MPLYLTTLSLPSPTFVSLLISSTALGTMMVISSSNWLMLWMGLVINLISVTPILLMNKSTATLEAAMKYFVTQSLAATIMICMLFLTPFYSTPLTSFLLLASLLLKLGAAPTHSWVPQVMNPLPWNQILLISTWQKIAPILILTYAFEMIQTTNIVIFSLLSMLIGAFGAWKAHSLKSLIAHSSIHHTGWMILLVTLCTKTTLLYLALYTTQMTILICLLNFPTKTPPHLFSPTWPNKSLPYFTMIFFSMASLPPFLGFIPKMMTLNLMMTQLFPLITLTLVLVSALLMTLIYLSLTLNTMKIFNPTQTNSTPPKMNLLAMTLLTSILFLPTVLLYMI